jgi:GTPase SAR1 family protein
MVGDANQSASTSSGVEKPPMVIITLGLAGSGKTTFIQRLNSYLHTNNKPPYIVNLDPAVSHLPFEANIDIRDTVNYEQVMKQSVAVFPHDTPSAKSNHSYSKDIILAQMEA